MREREETINVRLIQSRSMWVYTLTMVVGIAVVWWLIFRPFFAEISARHSAAPFTLDFTKEKDPLTVESMNGWNIMVTVNKGDHVETRLYDRDSGRLVGTIVTKAPADSAPTNPSSAP